MWLLTLMSIACLLGLGDSRVPIDVIDDGECGPVPLCAAPDPGCTARLMRDSNGCITGCTYDCDKCGPKLPCFRICDQGFLTDENGCETCQCKCGDLPSCPAPPPACRITLTKDANGCITGCDYDCPCGHELPLCPNHCPFGYLKDENGCETCQCKCGPLPVCAPPPNGCKAVLVRDENGCATGCDYDCPCGNRPRLCPNKCPYGYLRDRKGCDTCLCKCPLRRLCESKCPSGYAKDASGCPTCACELGLECHKWMKCSQGVCPNACACQPNCLVDIAQ